MSDSITGGGGGGGGRSLSCLMTREGRGNRAGWTSLSATGEGGGGKESSDSGGRRTWRWWKVNLWLWFHFFYHSFGTEIAVQTLNMFF